VLTLAVIPARAQRPVFINVGSEVDPAVGQPGALVSIPITLDINANLVAATDNFISVSSPLGIVQCQLAEMFESTFSLIDYQPRDCEGDANGGCPTARGLILNSNNMAITGSNVLLYTCDLRIASNAAEGTYPIVCSMALSSNPEGQAYDGTGRCRDRRTIPCETDEDCSAVGGSCRVLGETVCSDGMVMVLPAPSLNGGVGASLACAIGPAGGGSMTWLLVAPVVLACLRSRARRVGRSQGLDENNQRPA
jgi:hypothetical protein